jgi:arsenite methyltransferase
MKTREKEEIRQAVRENYGKVARAASHASETSSALSCCSRADLCAGGSKEVPCCGSPQVTLEQMSVAMGYSNSDLADAPEGANMGLGCGNPLALASLKPGEVVLDLGSGGGFDCFSAAKQVGETGMVIGVDMTPEMISKARKNAEEMGTNNVEFRLGEIEQIPAGDNSIDVIMSNCVINLSPDKAAVYREAFRVLKPGGRLGISDILATAALPKKVQEDLTLVAACIGGAATIEETKRMLEEAGFENIVIKPNEESRELIPQWDLGRGENAAEYVLSAYIEATKPA